jgi:hypothetical protein
MSDKDIETMAVMVAHRAVDIEATEQVEKRNGLGLALEAFCRAIADNSEQQNTDAEL